ncbi:MAG: aminotransferase class IV, partial [Saprospiraceae bacterium]|nr:aminotransferase class IV [Saprospiraceae bacterium]
NGTLLDPPPPGLLEVQRGLFYGDGLFESMRMLEGALPLWPRHFRRLQLGMRILGLEGPPGWQAADWEREIRAVASGNARIRLTVWRAPGGLYLPADNRLQFMVGVQAMDSSVWAWPETGIRLGLAEGLRLPVDAWSGLKTLNAGRYVAAARQAAARGWDDALLCNAYDRVCEASSSNVFWWEGPLLCTTLLSEGCVAGVMRAQVLDSALVAGYVVQEKAVTFTELQAQAGEIFLSNAVRGIIPVRNFAGKKLPSSRTRALFETILQSKSTPSL